MGGAMPGSSSSDSKTATKDKSSNYVMPTGAKGTSNSEIMAWAAKMGKVVPESEWKDTTKPTDTSSNNMKNLDLNNNNKLKKFDGASSGKLYDLKAFSDKTK